MPDAVLNALTREEWNAAYFIGLEELYRVRTCFTLKEQLLWGTKCLASAGHSFEGLDASCDGSLFATERVPESREHAICCREIAAGTFDTVGRAREALRFLGARFPDMSTEWLAAIVSLYESTHPEIAPGPSTAIRGPRVTKSENGGRARDRSPRAIQPHPEGFGDP